MKALEIRDLRKTYPGRRAPVEALKGVDLTVEPGEFFALLGPNGAGKSTLIGILTSLVIKTSGQVTVFGHDLDREVSVVKSCLGVVPQEFNFNIFESVLNTVVFQAGYYGLDVKTASKRAEKILKDLELWDKRMEPGRNLSGGMKRRLMLARALVNEPRLLILDEPTAGLDIELRRSLWEYLVRLNEAGTTIILTTHYLEEAENLCRRVAIIDEGRLLHDGSIRELLEELKGQTFVLDLVDACPDMPGLAPLQARWNSPYTLELDLQENQTVNQAFEILGRHNVQVRSLKPKSNRLEELFLRLVNSPVLAAKT